MSVRVLGSINLDTVYRVARLPAAGETITSAPPRRFAGGKGANQATAAAAWGVRASLIGAAGADEAGDFLLAHLRAAGVDVSSVARLAGAPTGQAVICVSDAGENTILVIGGANHAITAAEAMAADLAGATVFLSQLETPLEAIAAIFERREARSGSRILNAAPALPAARALFPLADILIVNQTELAVYAGAEAPETAAAAVTLARQLIGRPGQTVIVTLGAAGALAVTADADLVVPGHAAKVVDTTGAGDCFCGVLAAALSEGRDLAQALAWANAAAAISTETPGAAVSTTLRAETERRLEGVKAS